MDNIKELKEIIKLQLETIDNEINIFSGRVKNYSKEEFNIHVSLDNNLSIIRDTRKYLEKAKKELGNCYRDQIKNEMTSEIKIEIKIEALKEASYEIDHYKRRYNNLVSKLHDISEYEES